MDAVMELFDKIVDPDLLIRRVNITANRVVAECDLTQEAALEQLDLFTDFDAEQKQKEEENAALEREKRRQQAVISIRKKYGKNAILKGMNFEDGATTIDQNNQIGGHKEDKRGKEFGTDCGTES